MFHLSCKGLTLCLLGNFASLFVVCEFFYTISTFLKNYFRKTIKEWNNLDPDQAKCFVGPDLGPDCLQWLSADDTSRQRVKIDFHGSNVLLTHSIPCSQAQKKMVGKLLIKICSKLVRLPAWEDIYWLRLRYSKCICIFYRRRRCYLTKCDFYDAMACCLWQIYCRHTRGRGSTVASRNAGSVQTLIRQWSVSALVQHGKHMIKALMHGWKFSGLFLNSGFWGWLSSESQPQNTELGR